MRFLVIPIFLAIIAVLAVRERTGDLQTVSQSKPANFFQARKNLEKKILIDHFENSVVDSEPTKTFTKKLLTTGKFNHGYLYLKASVNGRALVLPDDIYINLAAATTTDRYQSFGGHLIAAESLGAPPEDAYTELIYDLSRVVFKERYFETEADKKTADWISVLNDDRGPELAAFMSTLGKGVIEEASFYYDCLSGTACGVETKDP